MAKIGLHKSDAENLVINGSMDFWQRGLSFVNVAATQYVADRWSVIMPVGGSGGVDVDASTDVPNADVKYSMLLTPNSYSRTYLSLVHKFESQFINSISKRDGRCIVSFWIKASKTGTINVGFRNVAAVSSDANYLKNVTIAAADTWERHVVSIPKTALPITNNNDATGGWALYFVLKASTIVSEGWQGLDKFGNAATDFNFSGADTVRIAGVMLHEGLEELPEFKRAGVTHDEEFRKCLRYFEKFKPFKFNNACQASQQPRIRIPMTEKRVAPTITGLTATAEYNMIASSWFTENIETSSFNYGLGASVGSNQTVRAQVDNLAADAEL